MPPNPVLAAYPEPVYAAPPPAAGTAEDHGRFFVPNDGTAWWINVHGTWHQAPTGGGGGGGFTTMDTESDGDSLTVPADASAHNLTFVYGSGATLLDLSSPASPSVLIAGFYNFHIGVFLDAGDDPGQFGQLSVQIEDFTIPLVLATLATNAYLGFGVGSGLGMWLTTGLLYMGLNDVITARMTIDGGADQVVDTALNTFYFH